MKLSVALDYSTDAPQGGKLLALSSTLAYLLSNIKDAEESHSQRNSTESPNKRFPGITRRASKLFRDIPVDTTAGSIDPSDVNETIFYLFQTNIPLYDIQPFILPPPTRTLASQFKGSSLVPIDSFLWHFILKLLDAASPTSFLRSKIPFTNFLSLLWGEIINQIKMAWETGFLIPRVPIAIKENSTELQKLLELDSDQFAIDLNSSLLHQKLQMLQICCFSKVCYN